MAICNSSLRSVHSRDSCAVFERTTIGDPMRTAHSHRTMAHSNKHQVTSTKSPDHYREPPCRGPPLPLPRHLVPGPLALGTATRGIGAWHPTPPPGLGPRAGTGRQEHAGAGTRHPVPGPLSLCHCTMTQCAMCLVPTDEYGREMDRDVSQYRLKGMTLGTVCCPVSVHLRALQDMSRGTVTRGGPGTGEQGHGD